MKLKMRPRLMLPIILLTCIIFLIVHILALIHLFYEHAGVALTQNEILEAFVGDGGLDEGSEMTRVQWIPKIIHQVFHNWEDPGNDTLPADWQAVSKTCRNLNEGWEYVVCLFRFC